MSAARKSKTMAKSGGRINVRVVEEPEEDEDDLPDFDDEDGELELDLDAIDDDDAPEVTDAKIEQLRHECVHSGDFEIVALCGRALAGDADARDECAEIIEDGD